MLVTNICTHSDIGGNIYTLGISGNIRSIWAVIEIMIWAAVQTALSTVNMAWLYFYYSYLVILWLHLHYSSKCFKSVGVQGLGEFIHNYVFSWNIDYNNFFQVNHYSDPVILYVNMFRTFVKLEICYKLNNLSVIGSQADRLTE